MLGLDPTTLDTVHRAINTLGGTNGGPYNAAIDDALAAIERLGGMDPMARLDVEGKADDARHEAVSADLGRRASRLVAAE